MRDYDRDLLLAPLLLNRGNCLAAITTDKLNSSVHDQLRCIHTSKMELTGVPILPRAVLGRRKWIFPAQAVPIVHVLAQHDQLRPADRLSPVQSFQQPIGGAAARTTP